MTYPAIDARDIGRSAATSRGGKKLPLGAFRFQTLFTVFLQRIGSNQVIGGQIYPFPVALAGVPLALSWLIWRGWARPSPTRILLYCAVAIGACVSMLLASNGVSDMSFYLYLGLYALFLFPVVLEDDAYTRFFRFVVNTVVILCVLGVAQYVLQFVWRPDWLFSWRTVISKDYLIEFNTLNETFWSSGIYKANGFFLMEASWLSQTAARAALIAVILLKDPRYLIPCGAAMLAAYSGTGIMLFALFGSIPLMMLFIRDRRILPWAIIGLMAVPFGMFAYAEQLNLELFVRRLEEFANPYASGYIRFVVTQQIFDTILREDLLTLFFGSGPGTVDAYFAGFVTDGFAPGWLKLCGDYGFWGFAAFTAFLSTCVYQTTRSMMLTGAAVFQFLWLDGGLVVPQAALILLLMMCAVVRKSTFNPLGRPQA